MNNVYQYIFIAIGAVTAAFAAAAVIRRVQKPIIWLVGAAVLSFGTAYAAYAMFETTQLTSYRLVRILALFYTAVICLLLVIRCFILQKTASAPQNGADAEYDDNRTRNEN